MAAVAAAADLIAGERRRKISGQLPSRVVRRASRRLVKLGSTEHRLEVAREEGAIRVRLLGDEAIRSTWFIPILIWPTRRSSTGQVALGTDLVGGRPHRRRTVSKRG